MSADDDLFDDDDAPAGGNVEAMLADVADGGADGANALGISFRGVVEWLNRRRVIVLVSGLAIAQAFFWLITLYMRSEARPVAEISLQTVRELAVDMLGHEVKVNQIYQLISMRGGRKMTVGLDLVLVLGQLPEERIEGAPRPTPDNFAAFVQAVRDMEPSIRSQVNLILQKIPPQDLGGVEAHAAIKEEVRAYVNDTLERLNFGKGLNKDIGRRRVTEVLLPQFIRQMM